MLETFFIFITNFHFINAKPALDDQKISEPKNIIEEENKDAFDTFAKTFDSFFLSPRIESAEKFNNSFNNIQAEVCAASSSYKEVKQQEILVEKNMFDLNPLHPSCIDNWNSILSHFLAYNVHSISSSLTSICEKCKKKIYLFFNLRKQDSLENLLINCSIYIKDSSSKLLFLDIISSKYVINYYNKNEKKADQIVTDLKNIITLLKPEFDKTPESKDNFEHDSFKSIILMKLEFYEKVFLHKISKKKFSVTFFLSLITADQISLSETKFLLKTFIKNIFSDGAFKKFSHLEIVEIFKALFLDYLTKEDIEEIIHFIFRMNKIREEETKDFAVIIYIISYFNIEFQTAFCEANEKNQILSRETEINLEDWINWDLILALENIHTLTGRRQPQQLLYIKIDYNKNPDLSFESCSKNFELLLKEFITKISCEKNFPKRVRAFHRFIDRYGRLVKLFPNIFFNFFVTEDFPNDTPIITAYINRMQNNQVNLSEVVKTCYLFALHLISFPEYYLKNFPGMLDSLDYGDISKAFKLNETRDHLNTSSYNEQAFAINSSLDKTARISADTLLDNENRLYTGSIVGAEKYKFRETRSDHQNPFSKVSFAEKNPHNTLEFPKKKKTSNSTFKAPPSDEPIPNDAYRKPLSNHLSQDQCLFLPSIIMFFKLACLDKKTNYYEKQRNLLELLYYNKNILTNHQVIDLIVEYLLIAQLNKSAFAEIFFYHVKLELLSNKNTHNNSNLTKIRSQLLGKRKIFSQRFQDFKGFFSQCFNCKIKEKIKSSEEDEKEPNDSKQNFLHFENKIIEQPKQIKKESVKILFNKIFGHRFNISDTEKLMNSVFLFLIIIKYEKNGSFDKCFNKFADMLKKSNDPDRSIAIVKNCFMIFFEYDKQVEQKNKNKQNKKDENDRKDERNKNYEKNLLAFEHIFKILKDLKTNCNEYHDIDRKYIDFYFFQILKIIDLKAKKTKKAEAKDLNDKEIDTLISELELT